MRLIYLPVALDVVTVFVRHGFLMIQAVTTFNPLFHGFTNVANAIDLRPDLAVCLHRLAQK